MRSFECGKTVLVVTRLPDGCTAEQVSAWMYTRTGAPTSTLIYATPDGRVAHIVYSTARAARTAQKECGDTRHKGEALRINNCRGSENCPKCRIDAGNGSNISVEKPNNNGSPRNGSGNGSSPNNNNRSPRGGHRRN